MAREFAQGTIPGSDVVMDGYTDPLDTTIPKLPFADLTSPNNPWLPKTDWSRDGIIANED